MYALAIATYHIIWKTSFCVAKYITDQKAGQTPNCTQTYQKKREENIQFYYFHTFVAAGTFKA